jgi:hypothetical protein
MHQDNCILQEIRSFDSLHRRTQMPRSQLVMSAMYFFVLNKRS